MKGRLETREELTRRYIDEAINTSSTFSIERAIKEVEMIVDCIMRAREVDMNNEFYIAIENELGSDNE